MFNTKSKSICESLLFSIDFFQKTLKLQNTNKELVEFKEKDSKQYRKNINILINKRLLFLFLLLFFINSISTIEKISIDSDPFKRNLSNNILSSSSFVRTNTIFSTGSEFLLRDIESVVNSLNICKMKLVESYVPPNFEVINKLYNQSFNPINQSLFNLKEINDIIAKDLFYQEDSKNSFSKKTTIKELKSITVKQAMGQEKDNTIHNELRVNNRNIEDYMHYSVESSNELIEICPDLKKTCCTEPQFLNLFLEFRTQKNKLLMKVRFFEKIVQILNEIDPETIDKFQSMINFYSEEYTEGAFDSQEYFKNEINFQVNNESVKKIILSLQAEALEKFKEYKTIIQSILKYFSGFVCTLCNAKTHKYFNLLSSNEEKTESSSHLPSQKEIEEENESIIQFDHSVCINFGDQLSKRIGIMGFLKKLSVVGMYFELVKKIRTKIFGTSQENIHQRRSNFKRKSNKFDKFSMKSSYSNIKKLTYWVGLRQIAIFCSEKENYDNEKCLNLCRKFFNITSTNFLSDENLLITNIFRDFYESLYKKESIAFQNSILGSKTEDFQIKYFDPRKIDISIPSIISSEITLQEELFANEREYCKAKDLFDELEKSHNDGEYFYFNNF